MLKVKIFKFNSLSDIQLEQKFCANALFITSTRSLNYQSNKDKNLNVIDFTKLQSNINVITKEKECLSQSEMRYLLYKTIKKIEDEKIRTAYLNSINLIYDLFDKLLISGISAKDINLKQIKKTQLSSCYDLFELYTNYLIELEQQKTTYQKAFSESLEEYVCQFENVSFVGFTFFNDLQNALFEILLKHNKLSSFYANDDFIINNFIIPLLQKHKVKYEVIPQVNKSKSKFDELRTSLFTYQELNQNITDSISIYKPFFTREMEFAFVVQDIVYKLKNCTTKEEIESASENIAIVITNQFAKQTQVFNEILKRQGIFIAPNNRIFYSQKEFLDSDYQRELTKEQRLQLFSDFDRLEMYEPPKTLFNSMIGRFIGEIYKISSNGMKLSNFATLLNINWLFRDTKIDDIISEFNVVKAFFENATTVEDWKTQIFNLIDIKHNCKFEKELRYHPLKSIRAETLEFIKDYILFLDHVTSKLKNVNGSVKKHIKSLIEAIKSETNSELLEKELLLEFEEILNSKDSNIDIDHEYFSQNFQTLLIEYLSNKKQKSNNIRINAINLESANQYDYVYVPMFEENKYPMTFKYEFPYTIEIVKILQNSDLINNYNLPLNKTMDYNIKLSRHVFENLFRIARKHIVFTRVESESGSPLDMSIFGYDIKTKLPNLIELENKEKTEKIKSETNKDLISKHIELHDTYLNELLQYFVCPKMFYYSNQFTNKDSYTDKFLLNFYCKALVVNKSILKLANGNIYDEQKLKSALYDTIDITANEIFALLPLFDDSNKNDIKLTAKNQIISFVNEKIFTGRYKPKNEFTLSLSKEKIIEHSNIKVLTYSNLIVTDLQTNDSYEFDISKMLDYLISTTGKKQTEETHFWDIVEELDSTKNIDKLNSLNYLSFKLNTQLNTDKFNADGIERTKDIIDLIKARNNTNMALKKSSACSYCKYKNICLGVIDYD